MISINRLYILSALLFSMLLFGQCKTQTNNKMARYYLAKTKRDSIEFITTRVINWQLDSIKKNGWRHAEDDWTNGALYVGIIAYAKAMRYDPLYYTLKKQVDEKLGYKLNQDSNRYFADFYCVGQLYAELYARFKEPKMLEDLKVLGDIPYCSDHTLNPYFG